jgi:hypothetical protein
MLTPFRLEILLILMQDRCTVCSDIPLALKSFWMHLIKLLGDVGLVESRFGPFGDIVSVSAI